MSVHADARPSRVLLQLAEGYRITQVLFTAARLGVVDHLRDGARTAADLAQRTGAQEPALERLLRTLATLGIVKADGDGFVPTATGSCLAADAPDSIRARVLFQGSVLYDHWADLCHAVLTGETVYQRRYGTDAWTRRQHDREAAQAFDAAMQEGAVERGELVAEAYDFRGVATLVDVGGGRGAFLARVLQARPALQGVLFDLPSVVGRAPAVLEAAGVSERCRVVAGSFFDTVATGGDAYILSVVVHDWDDAAATRILRQCRRAMTPTARLLLVERLVPDQANTPLDVCLSDLNMLSQLGGRERSGDEYRALLRAGGFTPGRIVPVGSSYSIIEAWPTAVSADDVSAAARGSAPSSPTHTNPDSVSSGDSRPGGLR